MKRSKHFLKAVWGEYLSLLRDDYIPEHPFDILDNGGKVKLTHVRSQTVIYLVISPNEDVCSIYVNGCLRKRFY